MSKEKPYTNEEMWKRTAIIRRILRIWAYTAMWLSVIGVVTLFLGKEIDSSERLIISGLILYALHIPIREYIKVKVGWKR